jgi:hypothetical protein
MRFTKKEETKIKIKTKNEKSFTYQPYLRVLHLPGQLLRRVLGQLLVQLKKQKPKHKAIKKKKPTYYNETIPCETKCYSVPVDLNELLGWQLVGRRLAVRYFPCFFKNSGKTRTFSFEKVVFFRD